MSNIPNSQKIAVKIGEIIDGENIDDVKLALLSIWELVHEIEKENV